MKKILLFILMGMFLISLASAETDGSILIGKQNSCIDLPQECATCSYVNITSFQYPNMTRIYLNELMSKNGYSFNYNFCNTTELGTYNYCMVGDVDGEDTTVCKDFEITYNGNQKPDSVLAVFFIICFILIIAFMGTYIIKGLTKFLDQEYGIKDLIFNVGAYFILIAFYFIQGEYFGNEMFENFLPFLIGITGFTNVAFGLFAFIWCHLKNLIKQKQEKDEFGPW